MLELSTGELVVVAFVTIAVVSALWWPRLGAAIAELLANGRTETKPGGAGAPLTKREKSRGSDASRDRTSSESSRG